MKKRRSDLQKYIRLVDFLGKSLGPSYEVFLYDLQQEEHPIVAIANGHLSGRKVGSLMKNVIVKMLSASGEKREEEDLLIRHDAVSRGGRQFKSSTMLLRDENGVAQGALCINFNVDPILNYQEFIRGLGEDLLQVQKIDLDQVIFAGETFSEDKMTSLDTLYHHIFEMNNDLDLMTPRDRQRFVGEFYRGGGFRHKGAVAFLAGHLNISEPTVYRYLSKAKQESER